ncbi:Telomere repeat-binding protein 3 [Sesamum angolense]|uniref:Telomere repeat-binding protein 3 n=1 Tax=Sesamum angolense TaxID=2727404 RepID=A0AAE1T944_9LAMI|nr:Telomere repeat-binding protein 3 [Sesamum angolense]
MSSQRRGPRKKLVEDSKLCAFELLAAVAGKLLEESESSASSNIAEGKVKVGSCLDGDEKMQPKDDIATKSESLDRGSSAESAFVPEICVQEHKLLFKGLPQAENDYVVDYSSVHASPDPFSHKVESEPKVQSEDEKYQIGDLSMANRSTVKDSIGECVNTDVLNNSESSVQLPLYREPVAGAFFRKHWNDVKLGIRDDDENSFGCNKSSTRIRPFRPQPRIGHRRIRKLMTSKYWKAAPKLKDCELYNTSEGMKSFYRYRKNIYARERSQRVPLKKRKLADHSFAVSYDQDASSGSISHLPEKGLTGDKGSLAMVLHRDNGVSATVSGHPKQKDPHVKLSIKSFKVPELYIEVPETATVGSLKRTVMEAVTTILGAGIRVGVVFQGKKVRDDCRTLQQAGISQWSNLDNLGFTLEPNFTRVSPSMTPKKLPALSSCDADWTLPRSPATSMMDSGISNTSVDTPVLAKLDDVGHNKYICSTKTPDDALLDGAVPDLKALVPVPPVNVEELAVVPANLKPKRSELSQRRTRRPFSVAEVEALVEAVEKLGTGRWRDVKMLAFENADHRTYVDLKDKWKTLVHTASIAPQQRRGEPVPHELLNRVLSAHSYWSQHQSKQQGKHTAEPLKVEDSTASDC